jgi:hypothetical protein
MWGRRIIAAVGFCLFLAGNVQSGQRARQQGPPPISSSSASGSARGTGTLISDPTAWRIDRREVEHEKRERRNTISQEMSARWALASFWAVVTQAIVAALALAALLADLRHNRKSSERQLRAYLTIDELTVDFRRNKQGIVTDGVIEAVWRNTGQTPALDIRSSIDWLSVAGKLPDDFTYPQENDDGSRHMMGPGQGFNSTARAFRIDDFSAAATRARRIFVWSSVDYTDVFGERRRTEVEAEMVVSALQSGEHNVQFSVSGRHNGIDGSCLLKS